MQPPAFQSRLQPALRGGGFVRPDYWVWCASPVADPAGEGFHLFASCWPKTVSFHPGWLTHSRIVRAFARDAAGPYVYVQDVLPPREASAWDGRMTHNPTIHRAADGTYLLFYTGSTFPTDPLDPASPRIARANQRIGLAAAAHPAGPWRRADRPILLPRDNNWDALLTTNPAACVQRDGSILLAYKSTAHETDLLRYGICKADHWSDSFKRLCDGPIFDFGPRQHVEDAYIWREAGVYQLLMKDMNGGICGEKHAGVHAWSPDGLRWALVDPPRAFSRTIRFDDGESSTLAAAERPQLLWQDGRPTHLFLATADGPGGFVHANNTWASVIPLR